MFKLSWRLSMITIVGLPVIMAVSKIYGEFYEVRLLFSGFYPHDAMLARVIVIATCPSVCPSRASIVSKRRKLAASFLHHLVAPRLYFSDAKFHHHILRGSPRTGASNMGWSEKFSDFLALSLNISKTVADTAKVSISD